MDDNSDVKELDLRPIHCELNPLTRSDGSAMFAQGSTCVLVSMHGPMEVKSQLMKIDRAYVDCVYRPKGGQVSAHDKFREAIIRATCDSSIITTLHPRSLISVQVQEMENRGGLDACCINAACLALLIGGVSMKFTFAAVQCVVDSSGNLKLDPSYLEEQSMIARFLIVYDSLEKNIVTIHTDGRFSRAQFNDAELLCRAASEKIFEFYRKIISKFHKKSLEEPPAEQENTDIVQDEAMESASDSDSDANSSD